MSSPIVCGILGILYGLFQNAKFLVSFIIIK